MYDTTENNSTLLLAMVIAPVSLLLLILSIYLVQPKIEKKLTQDLSSILKIHDIDATVSFSGRDGLLQGNVSTAKIIVQAEHLSTTVFGIRTLRNQLRVVEKNPELAIAQRLKKKETGRIFRQAPTPVIPTPPPSKNTQETDVDLIMAMMQSRALLPAENMPPTITPEKDLQKKRGLDQDKQPPAENKVASIPTDILFSKTLVIQEAPVLKNETKVVAKMLQKLEIGESMGSKPSFQTVSIAVPEKKTSTKILIVKKPDEEKTKESSESQALTDIINDFNLAL